MFGGSNSKLTASILLCLQIWLYLTPPRCGSALHDPLQLEQSRFVPYRFLSCSRDPNKQTHNSTVYTSHTESTELFVIIGKDVLSNCWLSGSQTKQNWDIIKAVLKREDYLLKPFQRLQIFRSFV